ncbi:hypothetical protein NEIG_00271 [Nematocida sp. ERTm5]|nr:hypothetical protein NEIG_00271 [Nematocida sp. ERTm5]
MAFIQKLAQAIESEFPKERADSSWDNTGILLEFDNTEENALLCIDLTKSVLEEAIEKGVQTILAYHPPIFTPLKQINQESPILYRCINKRISIYSPHTALDGGLNGINHWLSTLIPETEHINTFGYVQTYKNKVSINDILKSLTTSLSIRTVRYVLGDTHTLSTIPMNISIGAGASSRILKKYITSDQCIKDTSNLPSLIITGESSHHDLLYFQRMNVSVIVLEHSRSERGFLPILYTHIKALLPSADIYISQKDKDPIEFYTQE